MILTDDPTLFLWENCQYLHKNNTIEQLRNAIEKHLEYKTIVIRLDDKGIVGVCRFNVDDEKEAEILDVAVREDYRHKDVLVQLLRQGLEMYPNVKQLRFFSQDKQREFVSPVSLIQNKEK